MKISKNFERNAGKNVIGTVLNRMFKNKQTF